MPASAPTSGADLVALQMGLAMQRRSNGFDGFADGWMGCGFCGFDGFAKEALKRRLNARMEYAKFLQDTVKEMAKEILHSRSGEIKKTAEDLDEFINEFRRGGRVFNDEILGFAKFFNDELTLDNISRAFSVSGKRPEEVVQEAISSLPDEVVDTVQVTTMPSEDIVSERRRKLEFLEMQEELIKEEEEEEEEEQARMKESASSQKDVALEEMTTATAREAGEQARVKTMEKVEQLCELSRALAVLASASVRIGSN
uniref:Letm1 RBD domain-containing protein n=1 Tax=Fagus sylvatica TaxID=28930 RepID=A0A2N9GC29_FAGSY